MFVNFFFVCPRNYLNNVQDIIKVHFCQLRLVVSFNNILYTQLAEGRKIVASLHFQFIFFLLGKKSLRIISDFFFCLTGEYQVYQEYQEFTKNIPRTHMKSLHYWFLVSCGIKGVKSLLRFISNLFSSYWAKNRFAPFLLFFGLIGEYQVYQEYQEFTKNTRNTHEIASLLVSCGYLFSYTTNWA